MSAIISRFKAMFRVGEWLLYKSLFFLNIIYILMLASQKYDFYLFCSKIPLWSVLFVMLSMFGYWVNDCFDMEADALAGKENRASGYSRRLRIIIAVAPVIIAFAVIYVTVSEPITLLALILLQIILLLLYSVPPIRLKKRGWAAIICDAMYAYLIPVFITLSIFEIKIEINQIYLFLFSLFFGMRNMIQHQYDDRAADKTAAVYNLWNEKENWLKFIYFYLFVFELWFLVMYFCQYNFFLPTSLYLWVWFCWKIVLKNKSVRVENSDFPNRFYSTYLGIPLLSSLFFFDYNCLFIIILYIVLFLYFKLK